MKNLFAVDYFKNEANNEVTKDFVVVRRWLDEGHKVTVVMRALSDYFKLDVPYELEDIVEKDGQVYIKAVGYLFPFYDFTENCWVMKYPMGWRISDLSGEKPYHLEEYPEKAPYTRDIEVAKKQLAEGKILVCSWTGIKHTSPIIAFESMGGVPYIRTESGSKFILEPKTRFLTEGVLKWPSEIA